LVQEEDGETDGKEGKEGKGGKGGKINLVWEQVNLITFNLQQLCKLIIIHTPW
jgi:hypothetical protein